MTVRQRLWLCDWVIAGYCLVVSLLCVVRAAAVPFWWAFTLAHLAVIAAVALLVRFDRAGILALLRCWDGLLLVPLLFFMAMQIVHRVHPVDYDDVLIRIDGTIGGLAVLRAMVAIEKPWLTDVSKLLWMSYYFIPLVVAIPLYLKGREHFARMKSALMAGWLVSYLLYFALPAVGPGYHPQATGVPQPKWEDTAVSSHAKQVIRALEAEHPRHTFPSGHTIIAAIVAWYLVRHRLGAWAAIGVPVAAGIAFSTLYLRYHYLVDVLAGLAIAAGCVLISGRRAPTIAPPR